ncbi:MAG TPA: ATP synthase F1 subunit delta [Candidatus Angelobacter sp.]|jgi:F-type H+-transporting ATPase subunit delta|nr:ATP synthase F1 subunit delta [Candidatus Angelobacter sp.]
MASVTGRYARAFAEVVLDRGIDPSKAVQDLNSIAELMNSSPELRNVLANPSVVHKQKLGLVNAVVSAIGGSKILQNFISVLVEQRRIGQINEIAEQFKQELDERLGIAEARISSIRELNSQEKQFLEKQIATLTGKVIRAAYSRDPGLLGGVLVRVGSTIYDGSVRGQLQRIRQQITAS